MEEKQSVVIKGRTINRERPRERLERSYDGLSGTRRTRVHAETGFDSPFRLSDLRESRRISGMERESIRPRTHPYPYSSPGRRNPEDGLKINSLMKKIAISVLIALIILLLNSIKLPLPQAIVDQVRTAITHEFDPDETLGKLKFVGESIPDKVRSVFDQAAEDPKTEDGGTPSFRAPIQGEVIQAFREQVTLESSGGVYENKGIDIAAAEQAPFYATAAGIVAAVEEHETYGSSIWVDHGNQVFSFYGRCAQIDVKAGQSVRQGEKLGTVETPSEGGEPLLHFEIWMDDEPVDPLEYIKHADQSSGQRGV